MNEKSNGNSTYFKYLLIWCLLIFIYISILFLPFPRSFISIPKTSILIIILGLIGAISLKKSIYDSHEKVVKTIFALILLIPVLMLSNDLAFKVPRAESSIFKPHNFSCSMHHEEKVFDEWWELNKKDYLKFNITKEMFKEFPFSKGFSSSAFFKIKNVSVDKINIGDLVVYKRSNGKRIVHRLIGKTKRNETLYFTLRGDNTDYYERVRKDNIYGRLDESVISKAFGVFVKDGCENFLV